MADSSSTNAVSIRTHNETLSVVAMRVNNPDRSPFGMRHVVADEGLPSCSVFCRFLIG